MGAKEEARKIKIMFGAVILPIIILSFVAIKFSNMSRDIGATAADSVLKVKYFYRTGFKSPKQEAINKKLGQLNEAKALAESITSHVQYPLASVPGDVEEPGVYFKELLFYEQKRVVSIAQTRGIQLPGDLGFVERLPKEEEVPEMLSRLQLVSRLINIMADSNVQTIHEIEFTERKNYRDANEKQMSASNLSVAVSLDCELSHLSRVLREIGNISPVVLVEAITVTPGKGDLLRANLLVTEMVGAV